MIRTTYKKYPIPEPTDYLDQTYQWFREALEAIDNDIHSINISGGGSSLRIREQDGYPSVPYVNTIIVPNGAISESGNGVVVLNFQTGQEGSTILKPFITMLEPSNFYLDQNSGKYYSTINHGMNITGTLPLVFISVFDEDKKEILPFEKEIIDGSNVRIWFEKLPQNNVYVIVSAGSVIRETAIQEMLIEYLNNNETAIYEYFESEAMVLSLIF